MNDKDGDNTISDPEQAGWLSNTRPQDSTMHFHSTDHTIVHDLENSSKKNEQSTMLVEGSNLGKYVIQKLLGRGAMGAVFLGFDSMIEREVAIKILPPEIAEKPMALERFLTEAKSTGKLNHPHVVSIYDIGQEKGVYYIVMELITGGSVTGYVGQKGGVDWKEACRLTAEAAEGLAAAHEVGLVHRDIKPDNLMITKNGTLKIVDFGLSKLIDAANDSRQAETKAGTLLGTPQYMSPEQCGASQVDARSDIYSLGGTFFWLLTNRLPYQDVANIMQVMMAHLMHPVPDPLKYRAELPEACRDIVFKAMAKEPGNRYQHASEMALELRRLINDVSGKSQKSSITTYRILEHVHIVEPSKMQAMILKNLFIQSGVKHVEVSTNSHDAKVYLKSAVPDLILTAMELGDGLGIDLFNQELSKIAFAGMMILNSSNSTVDDLLRNDQGAAMALVSKKTKPDDILRSIHASSYLNIPESPLQEKIDPLASRIAIIFDGERIPLQFSEMLRRLNLLDLQVVSLERVVSGFPPAGEIDITIVLQQSARSLQDPRSTITVLDKINFETKAVAVVQEQGQNLVLRACRKSGFTSIMKSPFDDARMVRLIQIVQK